MLPKVPAQYASHLPQDLFGPENLREEALAKHVRLIDVVQPHHPVPLEMQVLCLGLSRTGTMSLITALEKLGYYSCHMKELAPLWHCVEMWNDGLKAKYYGQGKPYGKEEFDKLLGSFSAVTDIPCIMFVEELVAAYPNCKVILTKRDPDKWVVSMLNTIYVIISWNWERWVIPHMFDPIGRVTLWNYINCMRMIMDILTKGDPHNPVKLRQGYIDHYAQVRAVVPKDNLQEFKSEDGWEPLCKFLGRPVPEEPYPYINDAKSLIKVHNVLWWSIIVKYVFWTSLKVMIPVVGAWAYYQYINGALHGRFWREVAK